jgi:hypothetical protein
MAATPARPFSSRVRNILAFVTIVWGIAATFVAFEVVSLRGMDFALSYPALLGNVALSPTVTQSASCTVREGERSERRSPAEETGARVNAWFLGVSLGRDAVLRQFAASSSRSVDQLAAVRTGLSDRLGVPSPGVFRPAQMANANTEFVGFVEQNAGDTAHRLAVMFSPQTCELFKLGAFWGYSEMVRPALPGERAVFAMEIRYHAQRAEVPEPLWSPMLKRIPSDAKPDEITGQMTALTDGMTTYLSTRH